MKKTLHLTVVSWRQFLEESPPGAYATITNLTGGPSNAHLLKTPNLKLHCDSEHCDRRQFFACKTTKQFARTDRSNNFFFHYSCKNCNATIKIFAVRLTADDVGEGGDALKFGELPPFGPVVPDRVLRLIQPGSYLFLQGRKSEAHGLGIGAFIYYRRVVEDQKDRIFDEMIKVAETVGATVKQIGSLERAKASFQFTRSFRAIKSYIPDSLKVDGKNPMLLLHKALSHAVHNSSDEQCLERAREARLVLTDFARKLSEALREDAELKQAIGTLMKPGQTTGTDDASD